MSKCKKIIINVLSSIVIIVLLLSFIPITYIARPKGWDRDNITGLYSEKANSLDMIYIGGSACFVYWEPLRAFEKYGFTSYNYAHDTMSPVEIKYLIEETRKTQNPDLYLIDLRPFQYGDEYNTNGNIQDMYLEAPIRNAIMGMDFSPNRDRLISEIVKNGDSKLSYYFDFIKYQSEFKTNVFAPYHFSFYNNRINNTNKGFVFITDVSSVDYTNYNSVTEMEKIPDDVNAYFIDLLDYCKDKELNVLFIVHSYMQTKQHKKEYNYMKQVIDEYGFGFLNTNDYFEEIGYDTENDFYNNNHVNVFGAEKYTDFVGNYIVSNYTMPDKRGNLEYESWFDLNEEFKKTN